MNASNFSCFMENLKIDRKSTECCGYAFLTLTDRQLCKVIDYYYEIGELKIEYKNYMMYATFGNWSYPVTQYDKYGKYDLLNPSLV